MEENNSILSDIDRLNEHNLGQEDSNNYDDIEETEALVALSNAENSEGLLSEQQFSTQNPLETIQDPAFESQQTIFLKPQNAISSQSSFYEFENPIEGSFENDFSATVSSASQSHYEQEESQNYDALDVESDNDLDGELDLDDDDIPVSFKNALILNEQYQQELRSTIGTLMEALNENRSRQDKLKETIDSLEQGRPVKKPSQNAVIARNPVTVFHAPYFKDVNLYTHPPNDDTLKKQCNGEMDLYLTNPRELNETEKGSLVSAVKEDAIDKRLKLLIEEEKNVLTQMKDAGISKLGKIELRTRLRKLISEETDIRNLPDSVLFQDVNADYDWMKITARAFNRTVSVDTCRLMWKNLLNPTINTGKWTKQEDRKLSELVDQPDEDGLLRPRKDWDKIAKKLDSGRNAFLCFHRYQKKHNKICNNRKWTLAEDDRLKELVRQCRINRFIPWTKISYYMHNRTKDQCYQRYVYSIRDDVRQGYFEEDEDHILLVGAKLFGHDWARISHFIPSRTPMQIHSRFNTFLKANFENWTQEEDLQLLEKVKEKGTKDWKQIANEFQSRTRSQCRQRFYYIHKWYKRSGSDKFSLRNLAYTEMDTKQKMRQQRLYEKLNDKVEKFLKLHCIPEESDDEDLDIVDANFSVEKAREIKYHKTPDGEKVPMKALQDFMMDLRDRVPAADTGMKKPVKHNVGLIRSQMLDASGKVGIADAKSRRGPKAISLHHTVNNKKLQRLFAPAWPLRQTRIKEVYRNEKEMRMARQVGRTLLTILNGSELLNRGPECDMSLHQAMRGRNQCKANLVQERQKQFLEVIRAKVDEGSGDRGNTVITSQIATGMQAVPPVTVKPVIKTYSRKSKQTPYFKPSSSASRVCDPEPGAQDPKAPYVKFIPATVNTLVGMRGLLLSMKGLREQVVEPNYSQAGGTGHILETNFNDPIFFGVRRQKNSSNDNDDTPSNPVNNDGTLSHSEADARLRDRFLSLFFWPALMATIKPDERRDVFDIVEEDEVVAANNPLDVSEIIQNAQSKASVNPKIVRSQKRKSDVPKRVQIQLPPSSNNEDQRIMAPPPIKKRILVSAQHVAVASTSQEEF